MTSLISETHSHFQSISLVQILRADRELFSVLASEHRGNLKAAMGTKPPLDTLFEKLMYLQPTLPGDQFAWKFGPQM